MPVINSSNQVFTQTVSGLKFKQLCAFWQQRVQSLGQEGMLVTQEDFEPNQPEISFYLLLTPHFAALLMATPELDQKSYRVSFSWYLPYISNFLAQFRPKDLSIYRAAQAKLTTLGRLSNLDFAQNFIFQVSKLLCSQDSQEKEKLLNQVINQIRQSLELPIVLETAVREVRKLLGVDRLVIYQFLESVPTLNRVDHGKGKITYEAIASNNVTSILNLEPEDACFSYVPEYREKYRKGSVVAVENVENNYSSSFCLAEFLRKNEVRSKLVAPIVVQEDLWGLIIAHQCHEIRAWEQSEIQFLGYIGEHLAIAIYQAELYAQVQQQKNLFEQRVIERTQELYDTLVAAEAASLSKHEFLSNMSHELLTPLTCIIGLSGTLQRWSSAQKFLTPDKQQKYLKTIEENGKKLQELINDVLDFSQISAGKVVLDIQELSLTAMSKSLMEILQEEADQKEIHISLDKRSTEAEDRFFADKERVQKLLLHLLRNAIKFTPESGQVILRVWREYNQVVFQVEDTGIGISAEQIPQLFTSFYQVETSYARTHGGVGLGLALTKQLVDLHQGTIEVESSLNKGSIFTIRLPSQSSRKANLTNGVTSGPTNRSSKKTIVLISADEEMANLVCDLLTEDNYQVIWLIDSYLSTQKIEVIEPSLVILDHQLPDIFQVSQALKKSPKLKHIKALLFHELDAPLNWKSLAICGLDDYLMKPIQPYLLLEKVRYLLLLS